MTAGSVIDLVYYDKGIVSNIDAGGQNSGFIFSKLDEGTKSFNVDVIGDFGLVTFTFFIPVPGLKLDHQNVNWEAIYPGDDGGDLRFTLFDQNALPGDTALKRRDMNRSTR